MNNEAPRTNWNDLADIDAIPELSSSDFNCLEEVRQVLERHGKAKLFGVQLLHRHFPLAEDEVFLETQDPAQKILTYKAVAVSELAGVNTRATSWRLDDGTIRAMSDCASGEYGAHYGYKD